jgi:hypothetical protein
VSLLESVCRGKAREVLHEFMVGAPDEIDLSTIAWTLGKLRIEYGNLDTAEGRLVASTEGGFIRVRSGIRPDGRKRFVIAHELGHFCLHKAASALDTFSQLTDWGSGSRETEANLFGGELLMPDFLMKPRITKDEPSLAFLDSLASEFATSNLATCVQFVHYTTEPCALVISRHGKLAWCRKSETFEFWVRDELHPYSGAGEIFAGKSADTGKMVSVAAEAWLPQFEGNDKAEIKEDSREVRGYNMIVSLLWIDECI